MPWRSPGVVRATRRGILGISGPVGHQPGGSQRGGDTERRGQRRGTGLVVWDARCLMTRTSSAATPSDARIGRCMAGPILASILDAVLPHLGRKRGKMGPSRAH